MGKENYLNDITLKVFLFVLYGKGTITIPVSQYADSENFIRDIAKHKLQTYFSLVRNNKLFNDDDYKDFLDKEYFDYDLHSYPLKILLSEIYKDRLNDFIGGYVNNFEFDNLDSTTDHYYSFNKSLSGAVRVLNSFSKGINKEFTIKIPLKEDPQNRFYEKEVRFFETIFYLNLKKIISINSCNIIKDFKYQDEEKQKLDLNLTFKKDISSIKGISTEDLSSGDETILELFYEEHVGDIYIKNKNYKKKLSSPQYNSPNRIVFNYLYDHPEDDIQINILKKEVEEKTKDSFKKTLSKIAQELGFTGDIKKLFFITTKNTARLRIKVTKEQAFKANIDISKILP